MPQDAPWASTAFVVVREADATANRSAAPGAVPLPPRQEDARVSSHDTLIDRPYNTVTRCPDCRWNYVGCQEKAQRALLRHRALVHRGKP